MRWTLNLAEMSRKNLRTASLPPSAAIITIMAALLLLLPFSLRCGAAEQCVLVYQRNGKGYVHDNLAASAAAIWEVGRQYGFAVEVSTNPAVFTDANLRKYAALIFANSNNEAFDTDDQREAFRRFIRGGGGFVGIHSSTGTERQWNYFQEVQGAMFFRHSPFQKFTINVVDQKHPATAHLPETWNWSDECYFFTNLNSEIRVLLAAEMTSLRDPKQHTAPGQSLHGIFPLAWCHQFDGGRQ